MIEFIQCHRTLQETTIDGPSVAINAQHVVSVNAHPEFPETTIIWLTGNANYHVRQPYASVVRVINNWLVED